MPRPRAPFWLAQPSRFAGLPRGRAWVAAGAIVLLLLACLLGALASPDRRDESDRAEIARNLAIVDGVRHGGGYYRVAADALRDTDRSVSSGAVWLPTLAAIEAAMPPLAMLVLFYLLALATLVAWYRRLAPSLSRETPKLVATVMLACGIAATAKPDLVYVHETWAGLLLALSLASRRLDRWLSAAALGLAAALVCGAAAPYLLLMAILALFERRRREGIGWSVAIGVFGIAVALHAAALARFALPLGIAATDWHIGDVAEILANATGLGLAPGWIAAPLVGLAIVGWAAWRNDTGTRVAILLALAAAGIATLTQGDATLWGYLVAPTLLAGLIFVPDALCDLAAAMRETRRITVRRIAR